jgi:hypothetical protein
METMLLIKQLNQIQVEIDDEAYVKAITMLELLKKDSQELIDYLMFCRKTS